MNTISWAKSKTQILQQLDKNITKIENRLADSISKINSMDIGDENMTDAMRQYQVNARKLAQLKSQQADLQTEFYKYSSGFKGYTPTFSGSDFAGSSGSSSGSGSSATEKEVSNLEDLRDRYYEVNNALTQLNNKLDEYKTLMDKATDKDKISYLNQQLQILQKQETAYKNLRKEQEKELAELKSSLTSSGFSFSGDGTVANYQNRLNALTNYANSLSGDAKENAKSSVEAIAKNLERYTSLLLKEIPDVNKELLSLKNTTTEVNEEIKSIYKEKLDTVADVESQISELIKKNAEERIDAEKKALEKSIENDRKRIESKKKALQAEADLYNKQYSEDNYESELNEERNKLLQLQSEIDKLQFANDRKSQQRLSELLSQYESQQKLINDKIAEHQNQAINDRFEQEQELIDKELEAKENAYDNAIEELDKKLENFLSPQNLTNLVSSAMKSGFVDVLGETVNLNEAMNDMFADTEVGIANLNIQYNDWLTNLNSIKDTIVDINKYMDGAGLNSRIDLSATKGVTPQALSIDMGGINITGNVDRDVLEDINKMLKKQQEDILSIINKRLSGTR